MYAGEIDPLGELCRPTARTQRRAPSSIPRGHGAQAPSSRGAVTKPANSSSERTNRFENYVATHPVAQDYAAFRARTEREQKSWLLWPVAPRDGKLRVDDYDANTQRYHLYVQWLCDEQIAAVSTNDRTPAARRFISTSRSASIAMATMSGANASYLPSI